MKTKYLFIVLIVVFVLLIYNIFFYSFVNNHIKNGTENIISDYLKNVCNDCKFEYEYLGATSNEDNSINVFVKVDSDILKEYYHFIVDKNNTYQIINVNNDIPPYIK